MGATSTVPMMVALLVQQFQAAPPLSNVQVLYGETGEADRLNLSLSGRVTFQDETWGELGARSRREKYSIDGFVQARVPGASTQDALEAAWALVADVEAVLRQMMQPGDPTLSAACAATFPTATVQIENLEFKPKSGLQWPATEGVSYQVDFDIDVTARI